MNDKINEILEEIKNEVMKYSHGIAENVDEPYDEHDIIFVDEVVEIIDEVYRKAIKE